MEAVLETGRDPYQATHVVALLLGCSALDLQVAVANNSVGLLLLQTVYLAGDSTDEEQTTGEGDQEMLSESESDQDQDWDTEEDGDSAEE